TLGWVYYRKGSPRAALPYLEEAAELDAKNNPKRADGKRNVNPEILLHIATVKKELGDAAGAKTALTEALQLVPESHPTRARLLSALEELNNPATAAGTAEGTSNES
ncbi:MAG: hypothetical protein IT290_02560, partial [Deltaproteobacteria bacterium]|nr:hypothetical protein [Deltaproteobacteria bacterium]